MVPAVGDGPHAGGWISPLHPAIYPPLGERRSPGAPPRSPSFGRDSVVERPDGDPAADDTVAPGLYRFEERPPELSAGGAKTGQIVDFPARAGPAAPSASLQATRAAPQAPGYPVVWWDPSTLRLDIDAHFGLRQEELLSKDTSEAAVETDLDRYRTWRYGREQTLARAATPSLLVQTATDRADSKGEVRKKGSIPGTDVAVIELAHAPGRPSGKRFGSLVHAVLATVPLHRPSAAHEVARLHGRILGSTDAEVAAAAAAVTSVMRHPLLERARAAMARGECRREVPVALRDDDGTLVEGVVDLAFREGDRWTVVDFKTDRELDLALDVYRRQVALYAEMINKATGRLAAPCTGYGCSVSSATGVVTERGVSAVG